MWKQCLHLRSVNTHYDKVQPLKIMTLENFLMAWENIH